MAVLTARADERESPSERAHVARWIVLEALLLGAAADGALRSAPGGLGWTLWVVALALAALNVARRRELSVTREQLAWLVVAIACATAFSWRDADELRGWNVLGTLVALAMYAMSTTALPAPSVVGARVRDVLAAGVYAVRDIAFGAPALVARDAELHTLRPVSGGASWAAARSVILAVPLVVVFGALLSRADPVFASVFRLPEVNAGRLFEHLFLTGVFAWCSAGWMRGALLGSGTRATLPERLPVRLAMPEITTSLGAVLMLFALFVGLQIRWLFGGAEAVLASTGLTVAEYARRGFFELVAVAALMLPLLLCTGAAIDDEKVARRHRQLSLALIVLLAAIMVSALMRMRLYVGHFGLTTDRLYATAFMLWLGAVFVAMALTLLRGRPRLFAATAMLGGFATLLALNVLSPDRLVARVNLGRAPAPRGVDYVYLSRLSGDAAPAVVRALKAAAPSPTACDAATKMRDRWLRPDAPSWNVGARRGRASVAHDLSPRDVRRLCAGDAAAAAPRASALATPRAP